MRISTIARWAVVGALIVVLLSSAVWGYQPRQQHPNQTSTPAIPSPTWILGATGRFTATLTPTQVTRFSPEGSTGQSGIAGDAGGSPRQSTPTLAPTAVPRQPTPTPSAEVVRRGQRLFYELGCFHCHGVLAQGIEGPQIARTKMPLDGVISQVYLPVGDMLAFSEKAVSRSDIAAIYAYLQTLQPTGPRPEITTDRPDSATGEALYRYLGCFACHGDRAEGIFGPRLAGTPLSVEQLRAQVRIPRDRMPAYSPERVSDEELDRIYAFVQSMQPEEPRPEITTDRPNSATGKALYRYLGCFACHGDQAEGNIGPRLAGTQLGLEEVRTQVRTPRDRMPAFGSERVSDEELAHLYAFLQSLTP
ncbi:MAG TPA: hypothetical protein DEP84_09045 [Chloroflexi bacterium]|nr:hypothetical protein [Chloroflexota bacterium]